MSDESKQVQVTVKNTFATSDKNSQELNISVYDRAFRKLTHEKSGIGKIFPVYLKTDGIYRVFGIFTLNRLGSTSFFHELPDGTFFDHITFGNSLSKLNPHLTHVVDEGRKKVSGLLTEPLTNGTHLVATFIFQDLELLKLAPNVIIYPPIDIEQIELLKDALVTKGDYNGSGTLEAIGKEGCVVIQLFIIPKGIDFNKLQFTKSPLVHLLENFKEEKMKSIKISTAHLGHEFQDEYQFGFITFRYPEKIDAPMLLGFSMDKSQFYFNSSDEKLNTTIREASNKKK